MKQPIIVGNWKANKNLSQAKIWAEELAQKWSLADEAAEVVLAPSFIHLVFLKDFFTAKGLPIKLCAQNLSSYPNGAYTGEVSAEMLSGLVDYVLIGHSERRNYFQESEALLKEKVKKAQELGLNPIYCLSEVGGAIPEGVEWVAYEPLFAIGSGHPETPENANLVATEIKKRLSVKVLYGGSVKSDNVRGFIQQPNIDGLLVGGASLGVQEFLEIIKNAV